ncbi:hypothetical protein DRQ09_02705 [candidate division KSB1 bacterium]|nr:MAG: hypothetical protein DRQ09_02705 [candidate division KSB1 bacterium]
MKKFVVVLFVASFLFFYCSEKEISLQGTDFPLKNNQVRFEKKTLYAVEDTVIREEVKSGAGQVLFIGKYENFEAEILLKFEELPDTSTVNSAVLILNKKGLIGKGSPFKCSVYEITSDWQEDMNSFIENGAEFPVSYNRKEVGSFFSSNESTLDSVTIESELVNKWINSFEDNKGILISFSNSEFIKGYFSNETSKPPTIKINYIKDNRDTVEFYSATKGLFLIKGEVPGNNGFGIVNTATGGRVGLKFDLKDIPDYVTILRAKLKLDILSEKSLFSDFSIDSLKTVLFDTSWSVVPRSYYTTVTRENAIEDNKFETDITAFVQLWVSGGKDNYGLAVQSFKEGEDISYFAIALANEGNGYKPRLEIEYAVPPTKFLKRNENQP